ncbi:MAG TPA: biotin--[acetyl-CoA-carboxylase] ligase [Gemmatimonadales bacterium]|nr:biotin--[acetyl-CoA-carboxylase] ligase [Gemmatimonadales bacterium]
MTSPPRLHYFDRVTSTMDVLHELAADGAGQGTAVMAGEQLEGRGSRGRSWHSPPGGLWLSVLFRPPVIEGLEVMSLRAGLAVAEAVEALIQKPLQLKWPNDLVLDGRKVGGVLCEARWQGESLGWIAVGVGMNIRNRVPEELSSVAVSLAAFRPDVSPEALAQPVVESLRQLDPGAGQLSDSELGRFATRDWLRGRAIVEPVAGTLAGLRPDGALLVRTTLGAEVPVRSGPLRLAAVTHSR